MFGLGWQELLIFFMIVLLLFGGAKLPELARSLGSSLKEFKESVKDGKKDEIKDTPPADKPVE